MANTVPTVTVLVWLCIYEFAETESMAEKMIATGSRIHK